MIDIMRCPVCGTENNREYYTGPFGVEEDASYYAVELSQLPKLETDEENAQVFLTKFDGDVQSANFLSSLKKIK